MGFIPWDDDIDVGMSRVIIKKLSEFLNGKQVGKYVMETPFTQASDCFYPFLKIYDTATILMKSTKSRIKRGIYIDVFHLDGIGNSFKESKENYKVLDRKYIPGFALNNKKILIQLAELCKRYDFESYSWCGNPLGAWLSKEIMPKKCYGTSKTL